MTRTKARRMPRLAHCKTRKKGHATKGRVRSGLRTGDVNVTHCEEPFAPLADVPRATYSETVENPLNEPSPPIGRTARAIELRRRLAIPETRAAVVSYLVNLYRVSRDWRNVADTAGVSHRTMSRYVHDFPELERGAEQARATWQTPNGLAGYNAARAAT